MENPVTKVVSAFTPKNLIAFTLGFFAMNVVLDLFGISEWFYSPVATFKDKFGNKG